MTVFAPSGTPVATIRSNNQATFTLPETGRYVFRVNATNLATTGSYNVGLQCSPGDCVVNTLVAHPAAELSAAGVGADISGADAPTLNGPDDSEASTRLDPAAYRRLRDQLLVRSPTGRRYAALYATHSPEVVRLMLTDSQLRHAIVRGLLLWQADVTALAQGRGATVRVSGDQARVVDVVLSRLAEAGSPALRTAIEAERRRHPSGSSIAEAVLREITR